MKFKDEYIPLITFGRKTQTIRLCDYRDRPYRKGNLFTVDGHKYRVTSVRQKRFINLGVKDAKRDGFESLSKLRCALKELYPNVTNWHLAEVWIVSFVEAI